MGCWKWSELSAARVDETRKIATREMFNIHWRNYWIIGLIATAWLSLRFVVTLVLLSLFHPLWTWIRDRMNKTFISIILSLAVVWSLLWRPRRLVSHPQWIFSNYQWRKRVSHPASDEIISTITNNTTTDWRTWKKNCEENFLHIFLLFHSSAIFLFSLTLNLEKWIHKKYFGFLFISHGYKNRISYEFIRISSAKCENNFRAIIENFPQEKYKTNIKQIFN